jgi:hypothetical protein
MGVGGQRHAPAPYSGKETRYPLYGWTGTENLAHTGIRSPTVQPTTQHHNPEELTSQQHRCENLSLENDSLNRPVKKIHLHARPK